MKAIPIVKIKSPVARKPGISKVKIHPRGSNMMNDGVRGHLGEAHTPEMVHNAIERATPPKVKTSAVFAPKVHPESHPVISGLSIPVGLGATYYASNLPDENGERRGILAGLPIGLIAGGAFNLAGRRLFKLSPEEFKDVGKNSLEYYSHRIPEVNKTDTLKAKNMLDNLNTLHRRHGESGVEHILAYMHTRGHDTEGLLGKSWGWRMPEEFRAAEYHKSLAGKVPLLGGALYHTVSRPFMFMKSHI